MAKLQNALLAVGRFVLAAALCTSVVVALLSFSLQTVFEREVYTAAAEADTFVSSLHTEVLEHLESECLFYDLPYDTMSAALPAETVKAAVAERMAAVYDSLCTGEALPSVTLDSAPFKAAIDSFFDTLPVEERPLDPDASQTIAGELAESIGLVMSVGISDKLLATVHPLFAESSPLRQLVDVRVWLLLAVVVLAAVSLIPLKSSVRQRTYSTAGALFIGSALVAVPVWLFAGHDLPSKLAIGDSALREYVNTILNAVIDRMTVITTIAFIVSALLLVVSVTWLMFEKTKQESPLV